MIRFGGIEVFGISWVQKQNLVSPERNRTPKLMMLANKNIGWNKSYQLMEQGATTNILTLNADPITIYVRHCIRYSWW
jgi:hypothetical protein